MQKLIQYQSKGAFFENLSSPLRKLRKNWSDKQKITSFTPYLQGLRNSERIKFSQE